jgi:hypothetical protein
MSERIDVPRASMLTQNTKTPNCWGMEVELTPDQTAFIRQAIAAGRLHRPEKAGYGKRFLCGRNASAAVLKFLPPSILPKPHSLPAKAGSSPKIPCGNLPMK